MKKHTFLILLSLLLCFLFALSVSAQDTELRQSVSYNGQEVSITRFDNFTVDELASSLNNSKVLARQSSILDENSVVILKDSDGNLSAYPSYYIIELSSHSGNSYVAVSEINYSFINKMLGEAKFPSRQAAVVYMEFPRGLTSLRANSVFGAQNGVGYETIIEEIHVPNTVVTIESMAFRNSSLKSVYFDEGSTIKEIPSGTFTFSKNLTYFEFDKLSELEKINGFGDTGFKSLNLSKTKIETIGSGAFSGCPLEQIILPSSLKRIEGTAFSKAKITEFTFPENLEYFGDNVFSSASRFTLTSGILPKTLTYVGSHFMTNVILPELIVFPAGITQLPYEAFGNSSVATVDGEKGDLVLVFLGKMTNFDADGNDYRTWAKSLTVYFAQNTISDVTATVYSFTDKDAGTLSSSVSQSGTLTLDVSNSTPNTTSQITEQYIQIIFCGNKGSVEQSYIIKNDGSAITENRGLFNMSAHTCYAYSNNDNDCTAEKICIVCDINKANEGHAFIETITFPSFIDKGVKSQACTNENCLVSTDGIELKPIVVCLGYSISQFGQASITQGFIVNIDSLNAYISAGNSVEYGLIAGVLSVATSTPLELKDGCVTVKDGIRAVAVPSATINASIFEIKITNLTEAHFNTELILCMYISYNGAIEYLSANVQSANALSTSLSAQSK